MREILPIGTAVPINGKDYRIEAVIGEGASCIVYDASAENEFGAIRKYRLKECYPYHVPCHRDGDQLIWEDATQQAAVFSRFKKSINILSKLRDEHSLGNYITESEPYEANGTLYAVMPVNHAKTYDKDHSNDLHQILKTVLKLTRIVARLHSYGYLHLDIKPENFLVEYDPDPNIWLFDVDSLIPISDLRNGRTTCYSYSKEWAAPELVQGKLNRVCPATDLYSIGAILFHKVMGRPVSNEDIGLFAEWEFDSEIFEDVNPKVQRYLNEIFKHTLSATPKYRYQTATELEAVLVAACNHIGKPFLVSHDLQTAAHFIGREEEISNIHGTFAGGKKAVFLHGIGGIGKSSVAIAYANQYRKEYDTILFCRYRHSLEDILDDLVEEIQDFDGSTKDGRRMLKRLLDERTLLIIDNFDVATDAEPYLGEFLKLHARMIFTTRTDFREVLSSRSEQIEISEMPYEHLEVLFSKISRLEIGSAEQSDLLHDLLKTVDYHTYLTDLLARQVVSSGWTLDVLARKMKQGLHQLESAEKVKSNKDGLVVKQTIPEGLRVLFNMADMDEHSKQVLRNMYILDGFVGVNKETYKLFCNSKMYSSESRNDSGVLTWFHFSSYVPESADDINVLNELCEQGWVQKRYYGLYMLHPLIAELIFYDLNPCEGNCQKLYQYVDAVLKSYTCFSKYDDADEYEHRDHFELLCTFFNHIDLADPINRKMCMDFIQGSIECPDTPAHWLQELEFEDLISKLVQLAQQNMISETEQYEFYLKMFLMSMHLYHECGESEVQEKNVHSNYILALTAAQKLTEENQEQAVKRIHDEISWLLGQHNRPPKAFIQEIYPTHPEIFSGTVDKAFYESWYDLIPKINKSTPAENNQDDMDELDAWERHINKLSAAYWAAPDKLEYAQNLQKNTELQIYQVVACLMDFCEWHFWWYALYHEHNSEKVKTRIQETNYDGVEATMDYLEQLRQNQSWRKEYNGYSLYDNEFFQDGNTGEPCNYLNCSTLVWRIQLAAIHSDWNRFDALMESDEVDANYIEPTGTLWDVARTCWNIGCCRYVLKYLVQWIEKEEKDPSFDERECTSTYDAIVWYAQGACEEVGENSNLYSGFQQIVKDFKNRIASITGKKYTLKRDLQKTPE